MSYGMSYYRRTGTNYMNAIEQATGKLMSDLYPVLENRFWECVDNNNEIAIKFVINRLATILDELRATVGMGGE